VARRLVDPMMPDLVNAAFEAGAAAAVLNHCRVLYRDKLVRGVSVVSTAFFAAWGFWNLWYYPHLGQPWSGALAVGVCGANLLWIVLMVWYRDRDTAARRRQDLLAHLVAEGVACCHCGGVLKRGQVYCFGCRRTVVAA